jgi:hypothetical protein
MATKIELINKIMDPDNRIVLQAVAEMRVRGWLTDGSLRSIPLCRAQMQDADLMEADLCSVDFHQADLENADLSRAKLNAARFNRANLRGANFDHADLTYADFYKAELRWARNLTDKQLSKVRQMFGATMPNGDPYDGRFNLPADLELARWAKVDTTDQEAMAKFYGIPLEVYLAGQGVIKEKPLPKGIG